MSGTTCIICLEDAQSPVVVPCGHIHCEACLIKCIELCNNAVECPCPTCRAPFTIATLDLRFVPQKYHAFMQPAVRRVYPSPSDVVQTLEKRNDKLQTDNARFRERIDVLKRKNDHLQRDKQRLMDTCEASQAAVANYREKERQLRDDLETVSEENGVLELEVADWEKKYRDVKEKYSKLKKLLAEDKQRPSSSHAKKRSSTQAALEYSPGEGPSDSGDKNDRRLIIPMLKRPRLAGGRRSAPIDVDAAHRIDNRGASASGTAVAYVGRRPLPLRLGSPSVFDIIKVSSLDVSQELDDEERDGPSKARHYYPHENSQQSSSQASSSGQAPPHAQPSHAT
ncbi:uncharacterized protein PHACADRAFT_132340, partial [Phanerochaete carnosa HHB-10118-sp]